MTLLLYLFLEVMGVDITILSNSHLPVFDLLFVAAIAAVVLCLATITHVTNVGTSILHKACITIATNTNGERQLIIQIKHVLSCQLQCFYRKKNLVAA